MTPEVKPWEPVRVAFAPGRLGFGLNYGWSPFDYGVCSTLLPNVKAKVTLANGQTIIVRRKQ